MEPSPSSAKKRKMAMVPVQTRSKRRFSDDEDEAVVEVKKRFKRNHREGSERPAVSGKRQEREEGEEGEEGEQYREDVGLKRPRRGYFQDGDPPMEYEESSDEDDDDDETPATVPVSLSSGEDGEI
jgi:hypothetical protein